MHFTANDGQFLQKHQVLVLLQKKEFPQDSAAGSQDPKPA